MTTTDIWIITIYDCEYMEIWPYYFPTREVAIAKSLLLRLEPQYAYLYLYVRVLTPSTD